MWVVLAQLLWFILLAINLVVSLLDQTNMKNKSPINYWRQNKNWSKFIGKKGRVLYSTLIEAAGTDHSLSTPYAFALVELDGESSEIIELMGVGNEKLERGDKIECCLRKNPTLDQDGVIEYVIKAKKL